LSNSLLALNRRRKQKERRAMGAKNEFFISLREKSIRAVPMRCFVAKSTTKERGERKGIGIHSETIQRVKNKLNVMKNYLFTMHAATLRAS
jgi:hypothetical protein